MEETRNLELGSVQETLLLPLWGRAMETQKPEPKLIDNKAVSIINNIPYDFSKIAENINKLIRVTWIARSIYFDSKIKEFIAKNQNATIINIGCGLDTTFDRVDNGSIQWFDLDLPDVINLRKKYISETDRRHFIAKSVIDETWYDDINEPDKVMLLIAGVIYYFDGKTVKMLFDMFVEHFNQADIIFDYCSPKGMKISNKKVIENSGMNKAAYLKWSTNNIYELEKWNPKIKIITDIPMFKEYKKQYPIIIRIGMNIPDMIKVMSLAHLKIE
jgi:O-methyltransferase involved in polyketide biosynthesis